MRVAAYKPVISGFDKGEIAGSDTGEILAALGEAASDVAVARVSPWRFKAPLAPNMASRAEGKTLDCEALFAFSRHMLAQDHIETSLRGAAGDQAIDLAARRSPGGLLRSARNDGGKNSASPADLVLIEGVGGVMVPLDEKKTVLDWIVACGVPVVLVVGDYLGTISHTLTAVEVLRARGVDIAAVVVSESGESSVAFEVTRAEIAQWAAPIRVLAMRRGANGSALAALID